MNNEIALGNLEIMRLVCKGQKWENTDETIDYVINVLNKQSEWIYVESEEDLPQDIIEHLFLLDDGRVYYGYLNCNYELVIELNDDCSYYVHGDIVGWKDLKK